MPKLRHVALALGAGLLAANLATPARAADTLRIGTPEATSLSFGALDVGNASGIFGKYGIAVERLDFAGSAKLHPALAGGSIDMALGSGSDFLFIARGAPEIAVGVTQNRPNDLLIATRADGPIHSLADLKGTKFGVAGPGGLTLWIAMAASMKQGWGPKGMQYVYLGTVPAIDAALLSSNVDAVVTDIGAGYRMEEQGRGKVLALGGDVVGPFIAHLLFASNDLVANHPDTLRRFMKAMYETIAWERDHEAEVLKITAPRTGFSPELGHKVFSTLAPQMAVDGHFNKEAYEATKQSLVALEVVKPADMPADSKMYTEAFLP